MLHEMNRLVGFDFCREIFFDFFLRKLSTNQNL